MSGELGTERCPVCNHPQPRTSGPIVVNKVKGTSAYEPCYRVADLVTCTRCHNRWVWTGAMRIASRAALVESLAAGAGVRLRAGGRRDVASVSVAGRGKQRPRLPRSWRKYGG